MGGYFEDKGEEKERSKKLTRLGKKNLKKKLQLPAGLLAHVLVETLALGPTAPFDAAATVLTIGGLIVATTWPENFGEQKEAPAGGSSSSVAAAASSSSPKRTFAGQLQHAAAAIAADPKIALLGAMQALFEGEGVGFFGGEKKKKNQKNKTSTNERKKNSPFSTST